MQISLRAIPLKRPLFNASQYTRESSKIMTDTARDVKKDFNKTTETWNTNVSFKTEGKRDSRKIFTSDKVYWMLNVGTKPHTIVAKTAGGLRFTSGYTAKSMIRTIASRAGGQTGGYVVPPPKEVYHPGTEAREFDQVVAEKYDKVLFQKYSRLIARST